MRIILALRPVVSPSRVRCRGCILQAVKSWIAVPAQRSRQFNPFWIEGQNPCRPAVDVVFALCSRRRPGWGARPVERNRPACVCVAEHNLTLYRPPVSKGDGERPKPTAAWKALGKPSMQCSMLQLDPGGPGPLLDRGAGWIEAGLTHIADHRCDDPASAERGLGCHLVPPLPSRSLDGCSMSCRYSIQYMYRAQALCFPW